MNENYKNEKALTFCGACIAIDDKRGTSAVSRRQNAIYANVRKSRQMSFVLVLTRAFLASSRAVKLENLQKAVKKDQRTSGTG